MKEEALKLADDLEELHEQDLIDGVAHLSMPQASAMIRRLVAELDKPHKYDPETGEPLIDGYPLFSGLPRGKPLERTDVYGLAIESGFMLSTQHGQAEHKLMPVTDGDTLMALVKAIEERHGIK